MKIQNKAPWYLAYIMCILFAIADVKTYSCNSYLLLFQIPLTCIKIWGIFINSWTYLFIFLTLLIISENIMEIIKLNYRLLIPIVISIFASIFFIFGVGNLFNKLYKRALIQFLIGVIFGITHFYLVIMRWSLDIHMYFNTRLWSLSLVMLIYAIYVIHDTCACLLSKYNNKPNPKFLGVKIDN